MKVQSGSILSIQNDRRMTFMRRYNSRHDQSRGMLFLSLFPIF